MTIKKIKQLASISYLNNKLDEKIIKKISEKLTRKDLNQYVKTLKDLEKRKSVTIFLPETINSKSLEISLKEKFPGKKILFKVNKNLIAGIKIIDYDNIYDFSLANKLNNMISYIK